MILVEMEATASRGVITIAGVPIEVTGNYTVEQLIVKVRDLKKAIEDDAENDAIDASMHEGL